MKDSREMEPEAKRLVRTYKFRLLPRKGQHARLRAALDHTRDLYNAALEERIGAYRKAGITRTFFAQDAALTEYRRDEPGPWARSMQSWPLKRLDLAFRAFFARLKRGEKPGYPRFKGREWFNSFGFTASHGNGWSVRGRRLHAMGIGDIRMHMHRPLPSQPLSCQIRRDAGGWVALLVCVVAPEPLALVGTAIGLDLGITSFAAMSDGETVPGFKAGRRAQAEMRRRARALARCKRGSANRSKAKARLAHLHRHIASARRTFAHQLAARLVKANDLIAIEDLNVKGLARSALARDVHDAGWAAFISLLIEKAEKAARSVVKVRPHGTSQTCPACGQVKAKTLKERTHRCDCGCVLDRDVAAAKVILHRAIASPGDLNLGSA